jgi:hypothetical protein
MLLQYEYGVKEYKAELRFKKHKTGVQVCRRMKYKYIKKYSISAHKNKVQKPIKMKYRKRVHRRKRSISTHKEEELLH